MENMRGREYNSAYEGEHLNRIAFPLGGIGAGMMCLEGTGALSHVSLRHAPDMYNEPPMFAALTIKGAKTARVLEGPVPMWKAFGSVDSKFRGPGNGLQGRTYGLPRFKEVRFTARFPFGRVELKDRTMPATIELTGWSPFIPGNSHDSSLPVAALDYRIRNRTDKTIEGVFSFHSANFIKTGENSGASVQPIEGGFILTQPPIADKPADEGHVAVFTPDPGAQVDCAWFRGGWFDPLTMVWKAIASGQTIKSSPHPDKAGNGGSLYVPFKLKPKAEKTIRVLLAWYVPKSDLRAGANGDCGEGCACEKFYTPWYAGRFTSIRDVAGYWRDNADRLHQLSHTFSECFYDTTLPPEVIEAVAANLTILKSTTCLRQADGKFWGWEGCHDDAGCCRGTCTHVWNYAQALPHLFPDLERSLRETEFKVNQDARGHQNFRASLPIRAPDHEFHAAADGQLGGLMKLYREWRISGDTDWMKSLWPQARQSLDYCIAAWDPDHTGTLVEPHHNTYDIEFWGADGMCTSFYLGALQAAIAMGQACSEDVRPYQELLAKGKAAMESALWNGEYFVQRVQWTGLRAGDPSTGEAWNINYSPEAKTILQQEGPKYQYGTGCLADGVLGDWIARCCGLTPVLDKRKIARHITSAEVERVRVIVAHHMRPQQLADAEAGVTRRAAYRYFRDTHEAGVDVVLLALADHVATHGPDAQPERWARRIEAASKLLAEYWIRLAKGVAPTSLVSGDDLMAELGLPPGKRIGELLEAIREAQAAGEVGTRGEAIMLARRLV